MVYSRCYVALIIMIQEVTTAQKFLKENYGDKPKAGTYAIPYKTSRGDAFMKVVLSEDNKLSDFTLWKDKDLKETWY